MHKTKHTSNTLKSRDRVNQEINGKTIQFSPHRNSTFARPMGQNSGSPSDEILANISKHYPRFQSTIAHPFSIVGTGVHGGQLEHIHCLPAPEDTGIIFQIKTSAGDYQNVLARIDSVNGAELRSFIQGKNGVRVETVEHLMAAIASLPIDNLIIQVEGNEIPILDGSAIQFMKAFKMVGSLQQQKPRKYVQILKSVKVENDSSVGYVTPHNDFSVEIRIDFNHPRIGECSSSYTFDSTRFEEDFAPARTFGYISQLENLRAKGLAKGASLLNAIGLTETEIQSHGGLRFKDEFVRHKLLDAVGDLALGGWPLLGRVTTHRGSHALNNQLLTAIYADQTNYRFVTLQ